MKRLLFIGMNLIIGYGYSQNRISLEDYLTHLDSITDKSFYFQSNWIDSIQVNVDDKFDYLSVIEESISESGLRLYVHEDKHVFIYPNRLEFNKQKILTKGSKNLESIETIRIGDSQNYDENETYFLKGIVKDESNLPLSGVNIIVNNQLIEKTSDDGTYQLILKPNNYEIQFSYVGLEVERRLITFYSSGSLDISLFPDSQFLDEVVVEGNSLEQSEGNALVGVQKISIEKLEKLPSFLGNVDVIKSATALPGITVSGESSSYLNVRGGTNDQTLVLMNNSTIYNPGHLVGFLSVFNGDFISDMTVYKGNIPARYGIRASSVLDVEMNKWATKKINVYGGIGIIDSNLGVKTKLNDKLDIHFGGRISYLDWILDLIPDEAVLKSSVQFGDMNLSSRYQIDSKNVMNLTSYFGSDFFKYSDRIIYKWKTFNNGIKWSRVLNNDWIIESEVLQSSLLNSSEGLELNNEFSFENGISEFSFQSIASNENIETGIDISNFSILLGEIMPLESNSLVQRQSIQEEKILNLAGHFSYLINVQDRLEINPGLRMDFFINYGPAEVSVYRANSPYTSENVIGIKSYNSGEIISSQFALSPRVGLKYSLNRYTLRASYSRVNQFLHLISNTVLVNPSTIWKGSDSYIPPTVIDQYSLGYQYDLSDKNISVSIDGFYKRMNDLIDYRDGATLLLNEHLEQAILRGEGTSYGLEFSLSKSKGLISGLMSYTYSRTLATVRDEFQGVEINSGEKYPYYTDRPHSIKASVDFKATKKWTVSSNFVYLTGAPISAPLSVFEIDGVVIPYFAERNSERIPDYHRLDLVITLKSRIRKTKKNNDRWVLTLYNLYGRDNVANIYFSNNNNSPSQPFQLVNVGRVVPTITYKFEF